MERQRHPGVPAAAPFTGRPSAAPIPPMHLMAVRGKRQGAPPEQPQPVGSAMPTYATHGGHNPQTAHQIAAAKAEYERKVRRRGRRRRKVYGVMLVVLLGIAAAGWYGFREYIYGDDTTPTVDLER